MQTKRLSKKLRGAITFSVLLAAGVFAQSSSAPALAGYHRVGEQVYNIPRDAFATIQAIAYDGSYVILFTTGPLAGQSGSGWTDANLATTYGCLNNICVNQPVYNVRRDLFAQISAWAQDGTYVLTFTSGSLQGQTGHGWSRDDLAIEQGCTGDICVGEYVYNVTRGENCTVVALQDNGQFVLYFNDGPLAGQYGHGWSRSDLAVSGPYPPAPPHPHPPQPAPGEVTCTLTAGGRQFIGRGYDDGQATAAARDQCLRVETAPLCNTGSVVCHR